MYYIKSKNLADIKHDLDFILYFFKTQEYYNNAQTYFLKEEYEIIDEIPINDNHNLAINTKNGENIFAWHNGERLPETIEDRRSVVYISLIEQLFDNSDEKKNEFIQLLGYKFVEFENEMIVFNGVCTGLDRWVIAIPIDFESIDDANIQLVRIKNDMIVDFMENMKNV